MHGQQQGQQQQQIPFGMTTRKSKAKAKYRSLSTPLRSGRDDVIFGEVASCETQVPEAGPFGMLWGPGSV